MYFDELSYPLFFNSRKRIILIKNCTKHTLLIIPTDLNIT